MDGTNYGGPSSALPTSILRESSTSSHLKSASNLILPEPTYNPPNQSKKSHARKQPLGHIPRPRNAFILFRCDFVRQKKIPESVENDHRNISRIVGKIWQQMSHLEKEPWMKMAEQEKINHYRIHPGYKFASGVSSRKKIRRGDDIPHEMQNDELSLDEALYLALQRAASCPPGTLHIPQVNLECLNGYGIPLKTRDDLSRRPSRVTLYQSTPYDFDVDAQDPESFSDTGNPNYFMLSLKDGNAIPVAGHEGSPDVKFCGPRLTAARYPIPECNESTLSGWFEPVFPPPSNKSSKVKEEEDQPLLLQPPVFTNPFLSTLPPLPQSGLPFSLDCHSVGPLASEPLHSGETYRFGDDETGNDFIGGSNPASGDFPQNLSWSLDPGSYSSDLADEIIREFSRTLLGAPSKYKD